MKSRHFFNGPLFAAICFASLPGLLSGQWTGGPSGPIYYNGGSVGIGTATPSTTLEVTGHLTLSTDRSVIFTTGDNLTTNRGGVQFLTYDNGVDNVWTTTDQNGNTVSNATIRFGGFGSFNSAVVNLAVSGKIGIGTTSPAHELHVVGTVGAKEVIVSSTGADYVFSPEYRLAPLGEVAAYIQENHHLPQIPSAIEVQENGVGIGEMQTKLLAKIEELTLHMIRADGRNDRLEEENRRLQERIALIESRSASAGSMVDKKTKN